MERTVNPVKAPKMIQMSSEQSFKTGYGLVRTPGSIVTDVGKSQNVDPGGLRVDFDHMVK